MNPGRPKAMLFFRLVVAALPQLLVLLLLGGWLDLLGGINHTDAGLNILMFLFLVNPILALLLAFIEFAKRRTAIRRDPEARPSVWVNISLALLAETLITNLFIISQIKM